MSLKPSLVVSTLNLDEPDLRPENIVLLIQSEKCRHPYHAAGNVIAFFPAISDAAKKTGISHKTIANALKEDSGIGGRVWKRQ